MQRNIWLMAIGVIVVIILLNNTAYYFLTKKTLEDSFNEELLAHARRLEVSLEQSRRGAELFQDQIGRELRTASIAAQYALDPDIEKVTNEQLAELSQKLGISHITLLKRLQGDIVLYKSSDESQLGKSTKTWKPWYQVFNQLFDEKNASVDWLGQSLPNFWSGPFEVSSTDVDKINKWGYYYDGATNYIIDPYVGYDRQEEYEKATGVHRMIENSLQSSDSLLEIAFINPETFPDGENTIHPNGDVQGHKVQEPIFYGSYTIKSERDTELVRKAYLTKETVTLKETIGGKEIYKLFIPVFADDRGINITDRDGIPMDSYVLTLSSDYHIIQEKLDSQFLNLGVIIIVLTGISLLIAVVAMRYYRQSRDKAVRVTQETYVEEMNQLFQSIRAQRHDFLNHVQTIHSLAELNKSSELVAYTKELTGDIRLMNDIINIGNPAIAALVRSKISQAESHKIQFSCSFTGLNMKEMGVKTLDVNRMLGNLIDNAFDEVLKYDEDRRHVTLVGKQTAEDLEFTISNTCDQAEETVTKPLFDAGYSTKQQDHQGLGLSIVKSIAERYKGSVYVAAEPTGKLTFILRIPL
ncbi:sensor histidine kinase [Paenibacillus arenilitoris]|uniref:GHKL domain-containing protein n=1 Tax=Paenibacillus arenilitoris TaxID=2772299 RepID=A0A927H7F0_9BACL|nr:GHKL domain-containing protein [Paenibacillus arenilitoris]MBD2871546.1 GHKL domain-containing protein [Paenibacillus arenilitoris]